MSDTATLSMLAVAGRLVEAWCPHCGRTGTLRPGPLIDRLGASLAVSGVGRHLRCTRCGGRRCETRPHFPGFGVPSKRSPRD